MKLKRPKKDSYPDYFKPYISKVKGDVLQLLKNQEKEFIALLKSVSAKNLNHRYAVGKWSLRESLVHLIDTEQVFAYRAMCIARGEKKRLPGFDQDKYVRNGNLDHISKKQIKDNFSATRKASIHLFDSLSDNDWEKLGKVSDYKVDVGTFPWLIAGHTEHHFRIIKKKYLQ